MCCELVDSTSPAGQKLSAMLRNITEAYKETLTLLQLEAFHAVGLFTFKGHKAIALHITETLLDNGVLVPSVEQVEQILKLLAPLMCDQPDQPEEVPDPDIFAVEQEMVARLVHHFKVDVPDQQYAMLNSARKQFAAGGESRMKSTLPPVVFASYQLIFRYHAMREEDDRWERKCERILEFSIKTIGALSKITPDLSLRLFLQGALAADRIGLEKEAYEFISQAFTVFEEDISDSKEQMCALLLIVASFKRMQSLGEENHETLRTNCTRSATSLLKKPDQCRTVATCAHLFWSGRVKEMDGEPGKECQDGKRVAECLKRCGRITGQCMDTTVQVQLLIEVLNFYMLFYEKGNSQVTPSFLKQLIDKVKSESATLEASEEVAQINQHFQNTLAHIEYMQRLKVEGASYEGLVV